jgi:hypothetical protein
VDGAAGGTAFEFDEVELGGFEFEALLGEMIGDPV